MAGLESADGMVPYIVSCDWLHKKMVEKDMPNIVVVDMSWASTRDCHQEYQKNHIPGAVYINPLCGEHTEMYPRNVPTREKIENMAQEAGINADSHVVVYSSSDRCGYFLSGRGWWSFKYFGHENVSVLDGGISKWQQLGFPTTDQLEEVQHGNFKVNVSGKLCTMYDDVYNNQTKKSLQVCDCRTYGAYSGKDSPGHIPGAQNLTMANLVNLDTGILRSLEEMKYLFKGAGIDLQKPLATYCNSGMSSCTVAMAALMCGAKDASVFHGGFTEWKKRSKAEEIEKCSD